MKPGSCRVRAPVRDAREADMLWPFGQRTRSGRCPIEQRGNFHRFHPPIPPHLHSPSFITLLVLPSRSSPRQYSPPPRPSLPPDHFIPRSFPLYLLFLLILFSHPGFIAFSIDCPKISVIALNLLSIFFVAIIHETQNETKTKPYVRVE